MDYIEQLIAGNLEELNSSEPDSGHFERFEARLKAEKRVISFNWTTVWKVAAAVVFVLMAVNQVHLWLAEDEKAPVGLAGISPEYAEIEFFYTSSIQSGIDSWNSMAASGVVSKADDQMMQLELMEFERRYEEIRKEFEANPYDERVINALLGYYQAKLSIIEMIVSKLQEVKNQKSIRHETEI